MFKSKTTFPICFGIIVMIHISKEDFIVKKIVMLLCLLLVLAPTQVFAHSTVTESSPAADATVDQSPEKITIAFNTTISSMSTFTVLNAEQVEQEVSNIAVNDHELSGDISAPLANGIYTVQYQIIGADGHAVEGNYQFTVEAAAAETPAPTETTEPEATVEPSAEPSPSVEPSPDVTNDNTTTTDDEKGTQVWPFIVIGIIIVLAIIFAMRKRK